MEVALADYLNERKIFFQYEPFPIHYTVSRQYYPDFVLPPQAILLEAKGRFESTDRTKLLLVKAQHPLLDIRLVFSSLTAHLARGSKTTHEAWARKNGFPCCAMKDGLPEEWLFKQPTQEEMEYFLYYFNMSRGSNEIS